MNRSLLALTLGSIGTALGLAAACGVDSNSGPTLYVVGSSAAGHGGSGGAGLAGTAGSSGAGTAGVAGSAGISGAGGAAAGSGGASGLGGKGGTGELLDGGNDAPSDSAADAPSDAPAEASDDDAALGDAGGCLSGMVAVGSFCVDRYEAFVVEVDDAGNESEHSPFDVVDGLTIRAKVAEDVVPQGYISQVEASAACASAGKRLCTQVEFLQFCRGDDSSNDYPYGGDTRIPGDCNEGKGSSVPMFYGNDPNAWTYADFNDPKLNEWDGGLARTGEFVNCVSPYGVYDCVGNLHEWGADPPDQNGHGRFRGGFYGDAEENGHGCLYVTSAHEIAYHDYSTGFRCCMDAN